MNQKRILIVEDEVHIAEGIVMNLEAEGFRCIHCRDGRTGLDLYRSEKFDLIILDIMLPDIDGFEICRRNRREARAVPIHY